MGSLCSSTTEENGINVPSRSGASEKLMKNPAAPNNDSKFYDKIWESKTQGRGVFVTPQFTIKVPASQLETKRSEFWSKPSPLLTHQTTANQETSKCGTS